MAFLRALFRKPLPAPPIVAAAPSPFFIESPSPRMKLVSAVCHVDANTTSLPLLRAAAEKARNELVVLLKHPIPPEPQLQRVLDRIYRETGSSSADVRVLLPLEQDSWFSQWSKHTRRTKKDRYYMLMSKDGAFVDAAKADSETIEGANLERFALQIEHPPKSETRPDANTINNNSAVPAARERYRHVVLGGTFDRLHNGHKVLLTVACASATHKVSVGVSDGQGLLGRKSLSELIEPIDERIKTVREFLEQVAPGLEFNVFPITTPDGGVADMTDVDCLVVSDETIKGANLLNKMRTDRGLKALPVVSILEVQDMQTKVTCSQAKLSSSSLRREFLGTYVGRSERFPWAPFFEPLTKARQSRPYVVGLTGGIASGKSNVAKNLQRLGVAVVNCDLLGHEAYVKGSQAYEQTLSKFGQAITTSSGDIDRKKLGPIVFSDPAKLAALNGIVWPEIERLARAQLTSLHNAGVKLAVMEAALLFEAGWADRDRALVEERWVVSIPPELAIKRTVDRDGLSREAAEKRVKSQMSNADRLAKADVVLSTQFPFQETAAIVDSAFKQLQERVVWANAPQIGKPIEERWQAVAPGTVFDSSKFRMSWLDCLLGLHDWWFPHMENPQAALLAIWLISCREPLELEQRIATLPGGQRAIELYKERGRPSSLDADFLSDFHLAMLADRGKGTLGNVRSERWRTKQFQLRHGPARFGFSIMKPDLTGEGDAD